MEKRDLERQVNEQKAKCEAIEKRETERRQVEEKKHTEELQFLKRTNQQLKVGCCQRRSLSLRSLTLLKRGGISLLKLPIEHTHA